MQFATILLILHDIIGAQAIRSSLERNGFARAAAAKKHDIHRTTLFRKMKRLGIPPPEIDGRRHLYIMLLYASLMFGSLMK